MDVTQGIESQSERVPAKIVEDMLPPRELTRHTSIERQFFNPIELDSKGEIRETDVHEVVASLEVDFNLGLELRA